MARPGTFPKGKSGNPSGRPKSDFNLSIAAQKYGSEIVAFMVSTMRGEPIRKSAIVGGKVKSVLVCPNFEHQQRAAEWLADRGWGKSATVVAGPGGVGAAELVIHWGDPPPK